MKAKVKTVANRSGRIFPHNAIYEILTYRSWDKRIEEPRRYNQRTINEFWNILEHCSPKTRQAYNLVYCNGNTLKDAGVLMGCSATTVRRYLENVFYVRDKDSYMIHRMMRVSRATNLGLLNTMDSFKIDKIYKYVDKYFKESESLSKEDAKIILVCYGDGLSVQCISEFYRFPIEEVKKLVASYK